MGKARKWLWIALIAVAFVAVGYLRDFIAVNINFHLYHLQNETEHSAGHSFFDFLNRFSFWQIYIGKYAMTIIFTLVNFALGYALLRIVTHQKALLRIYIGMYVVVTIGALLFFGGGFLIGNSDGGYAFSRMLMGFLQSPVPAVILVFGYPLYQQSANRTA